MKYGCFIALGILLLPSVSGAAGIYVPSNLGYDVSYTTKVHPSDGFNFGIFSVTRGKAFTYNNRLVQQLSWARFGSATAPTVYMNLNAPYGKTVAGHIGSPKNCPTRVPTVSTTTEPTVCEGYNYGYNAARDAYLFAKQSDLTSRIWWLDVEMANSWSRDTAVNDATIQGAIDYLNSQNARVGIYSTERMWKTIAGASFVPIQVMNGVSFSTPNWLAIGISNIVGAANACAAKKSFIPGSSLWLIQYVANSTAIDQDFACSD